MQWLATCPHETVNVLESELHALGIQTQSKLYRGILFECDLETAYRAHLLLRTASRIQRIVARFEVPDLDSLQAELRKISWSEWLRSHRPFMVTPALTDEQAQALDENSIVTAVVQSIQNSEFKTHPPKFAPDSDQSVSIIPFIRDGVCVLGIDTAGRALHKRGWRTNGHPAVLKETLAASLLMLAGYTGEEPLLDPMCGSGTIAIEAAYIALQKAPLIHRGKDDFALEHLAGFDRPLWRRVSDGLRALKKSELSAPIYASDINSKYVDVARASALRARVGRHIDFSVRSFQDVEPPAPRGLLIMNLPYGQRIGAGTIQSLYGEVGNTIKRRFPHWRVALLVPNEAPDHFLALKGVKKFSLHNGALPVQLLIAGGK